MSSTTSRPGSTGSISALSTPSPAKGDQDFRWIGDRDFHHKSGELRYEQRDRPGSDNDARIVEGDIDGNGRADFRIVVAGLGELDAGDLVL